MKTAILALLGLGLVSLSGCANDDHETQSTYQTQTTSSYGK